MNKIQLLSGLRTGKLSRQSWVEQERLVDVFDVKRDVIQSLVEAGYNKDKFILMTKHPIIITQVNLEEYF